MNTALVATVVLSAMASMADAKSIPRTIIQTSKETTVDRPDWLSYQTSLKEANPNYELIHYSDAEARAFITEHYAGTILEDTYDIVTPIMRADIFRLAAIYKLGGFYMDMDMLGKQSLDPIVAAMDNDEYQAVFPKEWWMSTGYYTSIYPGRTPEDEEDHWQMGQYAFGVSLFCYTLLCIITVSYTIMIVFVGFDHRFWLIVIIMMMVNLLLVQESPVFVIVVWLFLQTPMCTV
jgi:hypothetical protein